MAKRFTDTTKYKKPFLRSLKAPYKLLWDYLYHDCDHAGIWIVDFDIAQIYIGLDAPVDKKEALQLFNQDETKIIEFDSGKKWFIPSFIEFQYGELSEKNRAHASVIRNLEKHNLIKDNKPLTSLLKGAKDKVKEKEKEKEKENSKFSFEDFWDLYDKKRGDKSKIQKKWDVLDEETKLYIMAYIPLYKQSQPDKTFRKDPQTFFNNKSWNDEIIITPSEKKKEHSTKKSFRP